MKSELDYPENAIASEFKRIGLLTMLFIVFMSSSGKLYALPQFFQNEVVKSGFNQPISVAFLPDGRALVAQKFGQVFILDPQQASPTSSAYLTLTDIDTVGERGLLDIVVDPNFATNSFIYVVYHRSSDTKLHISRFSHDGVTNTAGNEFEVWSDPNVFHHEFHHGGGLSFGPDGNLYLTTGEQFNGPDAQDLTKAAGKIIRVAPDGSIPAGNYCGVNTCTSGELPEIWAYGLRNPFRSRWDIPLSGTPRLFIGEVGGNDITANEDVHLGGAGVNYGWPFCNGAECVPPNSSYDVPWFTHEHNEYPGPNPGTAIVGGIVYRGGQFPAAYQGAYFYGDYAQRYIRYITIDTNGAPLVDNVFEPNETDAGLVVDLKEGPDGALYFIQIASNFNFTANSGALKRIRYTSGNQPPQITSATADVTSGAAPLAVQFVGAATDPENDPLQYTWVFGDGQQASGASVIHDYTQNGTYQAVLQVTENITNGQTVTLSPSIAINVGAAPTVTINEPTNGDIFRAGDTVNYSATATDDGPLTEASYKWTALFIHNEHTHPQFGPETGSSGTLHTPVSGHSFNTNTGFKLSVVVTDVDGLSTTETIEIFPEKVDITFNSNVNGVSLFIDGVISTMPLVYDTAIDFKHGVTVPQTACINNIHYSFDSWSNGEAGSFLYTVPTQNQTLTAIYTAGPPCDSNTNASPLAFADEATIGTNGSQVIDVLSNDIDPDGTLNASSVAVVQAPQHGTVNVNSSTGAITYNHNGSAGIADSFTYTVLDNTGAVSNEATVYMAITATSSSCGMSISLDGNDDWVNIPDMTLTGDFTIEAWVKLAPGIDAVDAIMGQEGPGADINFFGGKVHLYTASTPVDAVVANTATQADTWTHVAISRAGSNISLYLNGLLDATGTWSGSFPVQALGRGNNSSNNLQGELDEVRVWTVARSGSEISANYNQSVATGSTGLAAYWTFNETGQTVVDESGSGNGGSLGIDAGTGSDDPSRIVSTAPITENCSGGGGNQSPVAVNDSAGPVDPSASVSVDVLSNDSDSDGTLVAGTVTVVTAPSHGTTSIDGVTGAITYTDDGTATTDDTFTYTVEDNLGALSNEATVTVSINTTGGGGNQPPVAVNDSAGPVDPSASVSVDVLSNDSDSDGTLVAGTVTVVTAPSHGTTSIDVVTGVITYTDDGTATTDDTFTYTVEDNLGALSNEATVTVSITHANGTCGMGLSLDGSDDWVNVPNLVLPGDFTVEAWVKLSPGISAVDALIGQEGGGPDINFFGGKARLYTASTPLDAVIANTAMQAGTWTHIAISRSGTSISLYLNGLLDGTGTWSGSLPVQALGRGNQSALGYLEGELDEVRVWSVARSGSEINANYNQSVASGSTGLAAYWTFNESGQAVADESGSGNDGLLGVGAGTGSDDPSRIVSTAPITENCSGGGGNQSPVAVNDSAGPVDPSASVSVDVLSNDSDSDGTLVAGTVTVVTAPSHGTTSIDGVTGAITYTDDGTATTDDTFTYTVEDNLGALSNEATVTVSINTTGGGGNQSPVAVNDSAGSIDPSASVSVDVLSNDSDSDGTLVAGTVTVVTAPSHGTTSIDGVTGAITYTDDGTATTDDTFTYTVEDNLGALSNEATVTVSITHANGACGMGLSLDGSDDWVNVPNLVLPGDFTVEAWVKLSPGISAVDALIGQEGGGPDINFFGGKARLYTASTPLDAVIANTAMQAGTWTHIAISRSGTSISLYLNGLLDGTGTWSGSLPVQALGRGNQSALGYLEGELDEVRVWSVARSGSEINANYNQSVASGSTGLAAYWTFNESGQAVADESGSGNDGLLGVGAGTGSDDPSRIVSTAPITENCSGGGGNQSPVAVNDSAGPVDPSASVSIDVLSNDSDSDGTLVAGTVTVVTAPSHGTTSIDGVTGAITYTDDGTATTDDTFTYTVEDNLGALSNEATVTVSINTTGGGGNQSPVAVNDSAGPVDPSASVSVDVLSNDSDSDGTLVAGTVTVVTAPSHGTTSIDGVTGAITYTDDGTATTDDTFTYTVEDNLGALSNEATVTVSINTTGGGGNQPPVAVNDSAGPVDPSASVSVDVLSNDSDSDGTLVAGTVTVVTAPSHGTTSIDVVTGVITYTDDGTATTDDTFTYTVEDNLGALSNEATVTVSITHANGTCGMGLSLDGSDDWVNVPNLVLPGDFTVEAWVKLSPGISAVDALIGQEGGGPDINFFGGKARLYTASTPLDAVIANTAMQAGTWTHIAISRSGTSISLYLNGLLDGTGTWSGSLPVQALGRGNQSALGYLEGELDEVRVWSVARSGSEINANYNQSVASGSTGLAAYWTFNESGQAVADESGSGNDGLLGVGAGTGSDDPSRIVSTAPITENCSGGGGNQSPVAVNDSAGPVDPSASVSVDVLSNDSDSDGTLVAGTVTVVTAPSHGTTSIDGVTGAITYTDDGTATTDDTFTYTVEDNLGALSNEATVTVSINTTGGGGNQSPVAVNDSAGPVDPSASVSVDVLSNDSDSDGTLVAGTVTVVTAPSHGTTSIDGVTGAITYTDDGTATTDDTFTYTVEDNLGALSNEATVTVSINTTGGGGNQSPVAVNDSAGSIDPSASVSVDVLSNDSDSDGTLVAGTVAVVTAPSHGTTSIDGVTGAITYTDDGTATTDDTFTYTVEDNLGALSNEATVTVSITHANGACGMGLSLDGSDDWVNVPNLVLPGDFTVEAWVKLSPGISAVDALIGQEGGGPDINFFGGKARLYSATAPFDVVVAGTTMQANTWVHVAISRSGTSLSLYLNGLLDGTGTWSGSLPVQALGRGNQSALGYLEGELDEVRVWSVARSGSEINANYNQSVASGSTGLAAYWTFNESGQAVADESGSGNDGLLGVGAGTGSDDPSRIVSTAPITENCSGN